MKNGFCKVMHKTGKLITIIDAILLYVFMPILGAIEWFCNNIETIMNMFLVSILFFCPFAIVVYFALFEELSIGSLIIIIPCVLICYAILRFVILDIIEWCEETIKENGDAE